MKVTRIMNRLARRLGPELERQAKMRALNGLATGRGVSVGRNPEIYSPECIELGEDVHIGHSVRLQAIKSHHQQEFAPRIRIGRGSSLENNCTITCNNLVDLGADVLVAGNVFISDHEHEYQDPARPVRAQDLTTNGRVVIGAGSHIGQNVCIFGNVSIGEHCIIGAGSVVTRDIPAFSVAAGSPARVLRQYDRKTRQWQRVN